MSSCGEDKSPSGTAAFLRTMRLELFFIEIRTTE